MNRSFTYIYITLLFAAGMSSCSKKLDFSYDNRPVTQPATNSGTRLINLPGATELQINGTKLTSFLKPDVEGTYGPDQTMGTVYFPESGRLGLTYTIPQQFVNAQGMIEDLRLSSLSPKIYIPAERSFNLKDNPTSPFDYYYTYYSPTAGSLPDSLFAIPRGISPSSNPENCKIRLLNLSSASDHYHTGAMSLSWADGTLIAGAGNIAPGAYSDYIEIPYGSYQLKVLDNAGKEVPAKGNTGGGVYVLNPQTGTLMGAGNGTPGVGGFADDWLNYSPLKTYQPGGVYTIVVASIPGYSNPTGSPGETVGIYTNAFQVISDVSEPVNITYARLQAVNVLPGKEVHWQVDGTALGSTLVFTGQTAYGRYVTGTHTLKALDAQGAMLAEAPWQLSPGDNITAWVYAGKNGQAAISFSANNLSTKFNTGVSGNDGSYADVQDVYPYWMRFMNFCADLDEVTFTADNGQAFAGSTGSGRLHLALGVPVTEDPYIRQVVNSATRVLVYASKPDVLPGDWLSAITPLKGTDFIANTALYKTPLLPNSEPGIYTVALVGSTRAGVPPGEKARMIIIKHNR